MEIDTVHAWGKSIALSSDSDSLFAYGHDLFYDAQKKETLLKGEPMHAVKEGNLIRAKELLMANMDDKDKQHMRARGPGVVGMGEFDPKTHEHSKQAHWQDWLVVTKVKELGKSLDLITLTGHARFIDTMGQQRLNGRQLKLWMLNADDNKPAAKMPLPPSNVIAKKTEPKKKDAENKSLPHRLEATADVSLTSPDLIVLKSDYLNVWFKDVPAAVAPPVVEAKDPISPLKVDPTPQSVAKKEEKKDPPFILRRADRIDSWVNRSNGKNEMDKVHTEGHVRIHQDPKSDKEKGVDIAGHTVDMEHFVEGDYLTVTGNDELTGECHFDKISIIGDDIKIDQRDNTANVKGPGNMRLPSQTKLVGENKDKKPTKPEDIDIYWEDGMQLDGPIRSVRYEGRVMAIQKEKVHVGVNEKESRVLCEVMQVTLDRPLYLNHASKPKETGTTPKSKEEDDSPKVEKVLCDSAPSDPALAKTKVRNDVLVEELERLGHQVVKYQNSISKTAMMENIVNKAMVMGPDGKPKEVETSQNLMTTGGPGEVRIFDKGSSDPAGPKPVNGNKAKGKNEEETKLTWIKFDKGMRAVNNMPQRAVFRNSVELVHMPAKRHDVEINITNLPEGALYLRCEDHLEMTTQSRKMMNKLGEEVEVKWQEMLAVGNCRVRSDDFDGWSTTVTYSEEKSLLVFTGSPQNLAVMNRGEGKGRERKALRGEIIKYNIKTKDFSVDGAAN